MIPISQFKSYFPIRSSDQFIEIFVDCIFGTKKCAYKIKNNDDIVECNNFNNLENAEKTHKDGEALRFVPQTRPNLAFISLLLGMLEAKLAVANFSSLLSTEHDWPEISFVEVERSYLKLERIVREIEHRLVMFCSPAFTSSSSNRDDVTSSQTESLSLTTATRRRSIAVTRKSVGIIAQSIRARLNHSKSCKERLRIQTIYSLLPLHTNIQTSRNSNSNKDNENDVISGEKTDAEQLDNFGLAFATIAIAQQLSCLHFCDVDDADNDAVTSLNLWLCCAEDHVWLEFFALPHFEIVTADITCPNWNLMEDDCVTTAVHSQSAFAGVPTGATPLPHESTVLEPPPISAHIASRSRLYVNGCPVRCADAHLLVCAQLVSLVHFPVAEFRARLLSILHSHGLLIGYPLALTTLADLLEQQHQQKEQQNLLQLQLSHSASKAYFDRFVPTGLHQQKQEAISVSSLITANQLYVQAIMYSRAVYHDALVYPYISAAMSRWRLAGDWLGAMQLWREAARVISQYNYTSGDKDIYHEFLEIATNHIPAMVRQLAKEQQPIGENVRLLGEFLRFYDYLLVWESGSSIPVVHEGWVTRLKEVLCQFSAECRSRLCIVEEGDTDEENSEEDCVGERESSEEMRQQLEHLQLDHLYQRITAAHSNAHAIINNVKQNPTEMDVIVVEAQMNEKSQKTKKTEQQFKKKNEKFARCVIALSPPQKQRIQKFAQKQKQQQIMMRRKHNRQMRDDKLNQINKEKQRQMQIKERRARDKMWAENARKASTFWQIFRRTEERKTELENNDVINAEEQNADKNTTMMMQQEMLRKLWKRKLEDLCSNRVLNQNFLLNQFDLKWSNVPPYFDDVTHYDVDGDDQYDISNEEEVDDDDDAFGERESPEEDKMKRQQRAETEMKSEMIAELQNNNDDLNRDIKTTKMDVEHQKEEESQNISMRDENNNKIASSPMKPKHLVGDVILTEYQPETAEQQQQKKPEIKEVQNEKTNKNTINKEEEKTINYNYDESIGEILETEEEITRRIPPIILLERSVEIEAARWSAERIFFGQYDISPIREKEEKKSEAGHDCATTIIDMNNNNNGQSDSSQAELQNQPIKTRGEESTTTQTKQPIKFKLRLRSEKMKSICSLLVAASTNQSGARLNFTAIKLAFTAQSQVSLRRTSISSIYQVERAIHTHTHSHTHTRIGQSQQQAQLKQLHHHQRSNSNCSSSSANSGAVNTKNIGSNNSKRRSCATIASNSVSTLAVSSSASSCSATSSSKFD